MGNKRTYGVFILSHGRPDKQLTYTTLRRDGYTGPIRIVCDDEDESLPQYEKNFPGEVLVFNKQAAMDITDSFYNKPYRKTVCYARQILYDFAKQLGWTHFIMMDDDYLRFRYRWNSYDEKWGCHSMKGLNIENLDPLFDATFDLLDDTQAQVISFSQGGDMMGGAAGKGGVKLVNRKVMNTHFIDASRPLKFRGFVNEDVNLYVERPFNRFMFQTNRITMIPKITQTAKGGATDMYLDLGTYVKSFMSVICAPSCVKIDFRIGRVHHIVDFKLCCPKILDSKWRKK